MRSTAALLAILTLVPLSSAVPTESFQSRPEVVVFVREGVAEVHWAAFDVEAPTGFRVYGLIGDETTLLGSAASGESTFEAPLGYRRYGVSALFADGSESEISWAVSCVIINPNHTPPSIRITECDGGKARLHLAS